MNQQIVDWDLSNPAETRDPYEFVNEIKRVVKSQVQNPTDYVQTFGQLVYMNKFTRRAGDEIRRNASSYRGILEAAAFVVDEYWCKKIQDQYREEFLRGTFDNNQKNVDCVTYAQRWFNLMTSTIEGEREGEKSIIRKIQSRLPDSFHRYVGMANPRKLNALLRLIRDYQIGTKDFPPALGRISENESSKENDKKNSNYTPYRKTIKTDEVYEANFSGQPERTNDNERSNDV